MRGKRVNLAPQIDSVLVGRLFREGCDLRGEIYPFTPRNIISKNLNKKYMV